LLNRKENISLLDSKSC